MPGSCIEAAHYWSRETVLVERALFRNPLVTPRQPPAKPLEY